MKDNMFQLSCGHHQVSQVEIQSHMRIMHLYKIEVVFTAASVSLLDTFTF